MSAIRSLPVSRSVIGEAARTTIVDEVPTFDTRALVKIHDEGRKFGLVLVTAAQSFKGLGERLRDSVLTNAGVIGAMRPTAYLVNAARGGVLDEDALLQALRGKRIAGAGLDVFRQQPLPADSPIWHEPNVIVTPLVGGMSDIYLQQAFPTVAANLRCFLDGRLDAMHNIVTRCRPSHP